MGLRVSRDVNREISFLTFCNKKEKKKQKTQPRSSKSSSFNYFFNLLTENVKLPCQIACTGSSIESSESISSFLKQETGQFSRRTLRNKFRKIVKKTDYNAIHMSEYIVYLLMRRELTEQMHILSCRFSSPYSLRPWCRRLYLNRGSHSQSRSRTLFVFVDELTNPFRIWDLTSSRRCDPTTMLFSHI